jgi:hypothetical protein
MRNLVRIYVLATVTILISAAVYGQQRPRVAIENIQIGYPTSPESGEIVDERGRLSLHKAGFWTPVYVTLRAGAEDIVAGKVVVETTDSDDLQNTYTVPLPPAGLKAGDQLTMLAYAKTGSTSGEILVSAQADNKTVEQKKTFDSLGSGDALILTVGSRLPGLRQISANLSKEAPHQDRIRIAHLDRISDLPNRWFGYSPIDLLILTTGNRSFVADLIQEDKSRKEALAEWLRRGGRVVISCGRNQDMIADLLRRMQIPLPLTIAGSQDLPSIEGLNAWLPPGISSLKNLPPKDDLNASIAPLPVATLARKAGEEVEIIAPPSETERSPLLIARWPYGMGQVTLVAFDLDQPAFSEWQGQPHFWQRIFRKTGPKLPATGQLGNARPNVYGQADRAADIAGDLQKNLEVFKDVTVISFGWVALFILIYIVIVGPLDYFFLKNVVKRLELTWITFPTVVLVVSGAAYFTAYALKGNDMKINKVDLIDIDLPGREVYGSAWFTLFSPRIQLYTVGIEPAAPVWTSEPGSGNKAAGVVVSWMGHPDDRYGSYNRPRSQSLFRRTYAYEADATGLTGVPLQVWSTKSFTANWERPFASAFPAPKLHHRQDGEGLEGTITNPLPIALENAVLIFAEGQQVDSQVKALNLGTLGPGQSKPLVWRTPPAFSTWLTSDSFVATSAGNTSSNFSSPHLVKRIMFFDAASGQDNSRDSALRHLDQSWRRFFHSKAMLLAHLPRKEGPAETITRDEVSPTRLWLGQLPSSGGNRPELAGTLAQDTFVRIFINLNPPHEAKPPVAN